MAVLWSHACSTVVLEAGVNNNVRLTSEKKVVNSLFYLQVLCSNRFRAVSDSLEL